MAKNNADKLGILHNNILLQEFYRLKQELSDQRYSNTSSVKLARFDELQKHVQNLEGAKEKIKQKIIASDESPDNSVLYTAMAKFKKTNE